MSEENTFVSGVGSNTKALKLPLNAHPLPQDKFVSIGVCPSTQKQITLCYHTFGNPLHDAFLLVRGLATTLLGWPDVFCRKLAEAGFYVIRYDNRDVGLSTHLDGLPTTVIQRMILPTWLSIGEGAPPYSLRDMARDGMLLLTKLKINRAHIIGTSMGAMIVQCMAIDFPQRINSLTVMYGHSSGPHVKPQSFKMKRSFLEKPASSSMSDMVAFKLRQAKLSVGDYNFDQSYWKEHFETTLNRCPDDVKGTNRHIWAIQRTPSRTNELRSLHGFPILIIHGMQDCIIPYQNALELAQLMPHAKLILYPRMGHYHPPQLDDDIIAELKLLSLKCNV